MLPEQGRNPLGLDTSGAEVGAPLSLPFAKSAIASRQFVLHDLDLAAEPVALGGQHGAFLCEGLDLRRGDPAQVSADRFQFVRRVLELVDETVVLDPDLVEFYQELLVLGRDRLVTVV